jgi:hypothetical protein
MNGNREFASMLVKTTSAKGHFSGFAGKRALPNL